MFPGISFPKHAIEKLAKSHSHAKYLIFKDNNTNNPNIYSSMPGMTS